MSVMKDNSTNGSNFLWSFKEYKKSLYSFSHHFPLQMKYILQITPRRTR